MSERKKINWHEALAIAFLILVTAVLTFSATWWFMDVQVKENQEVSDQITAGLRARINQYALKLKGFEDTNEATQTYTGTGFSINYPNTWVYRVYDGSSNGLVAFADKEADLPAANSDQQPGISITTAKSAAQAKDLTTDESKASKSTVTIGTNITGTKWTLAAGRANDLGGEQKIVIYEVKLKDNTYIRIQNVADNNLAVFTKMLASLKLSQ